MATEHWVDFPHIVCNPRIQGGEPTISGTRVPVRAIVVAHRFDPRVANLCEAYPALTPELIQEALDFYDAHQAEIDQLIRENEADLD